MFTECRFLLRPGVYFGAGNILGLNYALKLAHNLTIAAATTQETVFDCAAPGPDGAPPQEKGFLNVRHSQAAVLILEGVTVRGCNLQGYAYDSLDYEMLFETLPVSPLQVQLFALRTCHLFALRTGHL
jgi:hypothetical protein